MSGKDAENAGRRDFLKALMLWMSGLIGATVAAPATAFLLAPAFHSDEDGAWVEAAPLEQYPFGEPRLFEFTRTKVNGWERTAMPYGAFVVRREASNVRVFSNICTHLGCHVSWNAEAQHYISPCHDGHFDISGMNISGPPPRPLDEFTTRIQDGRLFIELPPVRRES